MVLLITATEARICSDAMALLDTIGGQLSTCFRGVEVTHLYLDGTVLVRNHYTGQEERYATIQEFMQAYNI